MNLPAKGREARQWQKARSRRLLEAKVSEAQIAVHWREEEYYPPPPKFVEQANANDRAIFEWFTEDKFPAVSRSTRTC